uniref:Protein kinase domain-containing protein n=1 Tax=Anopheles christyi TaxID=43041 RepID=A0A182JR44_9DIPT
MLTSEYEYHYVEKHQFRTLPDDYMPGMITEIMVERFETNVRDSRLVDAVISWKPAKDKTCHYEIVCHASFSTDFLLKPIDVQQPEVLYKYTIKSLKLSANYMIAVRSKNTQNAMKESQLHWQPFHTPSCTNLTNGTQVCAPEPITNVRVTQVPLYGDHYQLNISWDRPAIAPDSYVVKVFDLHNPETEEPGNSVTKNLTGDAVGLLIDSIEMFGPHFEVLVAAYSRVGVSSESTLKALQIGRVSSAESWIRTKLVFIILTPVLMIGLLKISISLICRRRAKLKRYEERCEYFKELEQKAPVNPSTEFEPTSKQMQDLLASSDPFSLELIAPINDELEIEMEHIKLHDMLGEGAFGLVRKGVLQRNCEEDEAAKPVAVKMLKECPRVEDIIEFRREMEVMKSVGTHPHIVGIVGHCTRNVRKMMLLTEFCGRGNLLNYLRLQWQRLLRQNRTTLSIGATNTATSSALVPSDSLDGCISGTAEHECLTPSLDNNKMPENVFNFDTSFVNDKKSLTYKNISDPRQTLLGAVFKAGSDGSSQRSPHIIENKLYPLFNEENDRDEMVKLTRKAYYCTNACKNAVEIVDGQRRETGEKDAKNGEVDMCEGGRSSVRIKPCSCHDGLALDSTLTNNTVENRCYQSCSPSSDEEDPPPNSGQLYDLMYSCWNLHPGERPTFSKIVHTVEQLQQKDTANDPVIIDLHAIVDSHW